MEEGGGDCHVVVPGGHGPSPCDANLPYSQRLVVFKLVHTAPHHLKRPLSTVDALNTNHVSLRIYPVAQQNQVDNSITVKWEHFADITCELFSQKEVDPTHFQSHLMSWALDASDVNICDSIGYFSSSSTVCIFNVKVKVKVKVNFIFILFLFLDWIGS